jgi:hypothetical protein
MPKVSASAVTKEPAISRQVTRAKSREARSMYQRGFPLIDIAKDLGRNTTPSPAGSGAGMG